jgi:UDP-2,3-diacylglucosamine hydrolase
MTALHAAANKSRLLVLGGDIFDFKWSTAGTIDQTAVAAIDWLRDLLQAHHQCAFYFLLGNHDSVPGFVSRLCELAEQIENLSWQPHYLRVGPTVLLHGDVVDRPTTHSALRKQRRRWADEAAGKYPWQHQIYDVATHLQLHRVVGSLIHQNRRVANRLLYYLDDVGHGPASGLRDVYFGHTHVPVEGFVHQGVRFHNGGASIRGLRFRTVPFQLPVNWRDIIRGG